MFIQLTWPEIVLRLVLTAIAGGLIGINREERGHSAGLRTTMLVSLAAALSMIQVNLLLDLNGKSSSSFVVMDLMRLPLGILSGMGFIGAGAIIRKETLVTGVTTAATLWFSTIMGLCFGGGQIILGLAALAFGICILWGLKAVEMRWHKPLQGTLTLTMEKKEFDAEEIDKKITEGGARIAHWLEFIIENHGKTRRQTCWVVLNKYTECGEPGFLDSLSKTPGITHLEWKATGRGS